LRTPLRKRNRSAQTEHQSASNGVEIQVWRFIGPICREDRFTVSNGNDGLAVGGAIMRRVQFPEDAAQVSLR